MAPLTPGGAADRVARLANLFDTEVGLNRATVAMVLTAGRGRTTRVVGHGGPLGVSRPAGSLSEALDGLTIGAETTWH